MEAAGQCFDGDAEVCGKRRRDTPRASDKKAQNIAFLDAQAHYINGVGFYEQADACATFTSDHIN
ncbi:MAG: hypothetical protein IKW93_07025 [Bacteroidales bacterium]|nr:hypothetical protein [Bacteroidales bacterium]